MNSAVTVILIVSSIILILTVLLQQRGSGLGGAFGGSGAVYQTKRGIERGVFISTIVFGILFVISAFARILLNS